MERRQGPTCSTSELDDVELGDDLALLESLLGKGDAGAAALQCVWPTGGRQLMQPSELGVEEIGTLAPPGELSRGVPLQPLGRTGGCGWRSFRKNGSVCRRAGGWGERGRESVGEVSETHEEECERRP